MTLEQFKSRLLIMGFEPWGLSWDNLLRFKHGGVFVWIFPSGRVIISDGQHQEDQDNPRCYSLLWACVQAYLEQADDT